jgi:hypothetical protein
MSHLDIRYEDAERCLADIQYEALEIDWLDVDSEEFDAECWLDLFEAE